MNSLKTAVLSLLSVWQWTRRFRQPACRFYPSCSQYTRQAIEKHGLARGLQLGVVRICKCHPFHDGGVDEVPDEVQNVMKSRLKPVFIGSDARINAQAFCLNTPPQASAASARNSKAAKISKNQPSNTNGNA